MTEPKSKNMDGDSFSVWLYKVAREVDRISAVAEVYGSGREWSAGAFNCNYDPRVAACEWLRHQLAVFRG